MIEGATVTLPLDTILENRYHLQRLLARGGMGAIYQAFDVKLEVSVAIKENFFHTPHSIQQFKQEALILARLHHTNLPRVTDHFNIEDQQYLVMDFVEGQDLWEIVTAQRQPLTEAQAVDYILQVCDAVKYLHHQHPPIIHRDIKPQNIKIKPDGTAVLVDFGIARVVEGGERTHTGARGMTPGFSPPEQYSGIGTTPASDIYALGATLYAILTGQRPPDSISLMVGGEKYQPPNIINPKLSAGITRAIIHAMQVRPQNRPGSVAEWQQELCGIGKNQFTTLLDDAPKTSPANSGVGLSPEAGRSSLTGKRSRRIWGILAVVILLLGVSLGGITIAINRIRGPAIPEETVAAISGTIVVPPTPTSAPTATPRPTTTDTPPAAASPSPTKLTGVSKNDALSLPTATNTPLPTATVEPTPTQPFPTPLPQNTATPVIPTATVFPTISSAPVSSAACPNPQVQITSPTAGATISGRNVPIRGTANTPDFVFYKVQYMSATMSDWHELYQNDVPVVDDILLTWDTTTVIPGQHKLVLRVHDPTGNYTECEIQVTVTQ